jgi:hypothetical protein
MWQPLYLIQPLLSEPKLGGFVPKTLFMSLNRQELRQGLSELLFIPIQQIHIVKLVDSPKSFDTLKANPADVAALPPNTG